MDLMTSRRILNYYAVQILQLQRRKRESFENKYFELISKAEGLLKSNITVTEKTHTISQIFQTQSGQLDVKLPQIKILEFSGAYKKWFNFRDTFNTLINSNPSLNDIQKYFYLQSALQGEATHVISSLEISEANYKVAWNLLTARFENEKVIIRTHLKNIFELPNVASNSHVSLRQFSDNFLKHYRALENLNLPVNTRDAILLYLLINKLGFISKKEWETSTSQNENPTTQDFINFVAKRYQFLESIDAKKSSISTKKYDSKTQSHVVVYLATFVKELITFTHVKNFWT